MWKKTKEMIVDFRKTNRNHPLPICIEGVEVEVVSSYKYLGVHISNNFNWKINCSSLVKKAHQRLYFLRRLKQAGLGTTVLTPFYRCTVESILTLSITAWYGNCTDADRKALQRVVKTAEKVIGNQRHIPQ